MKQSESDILRNLLDKFRRAAPEKQAAMLNSLTSGINQTTDADVKRWLGELKTRLEWIRGTESTYQIHEKVWITFDNRKITARRQLELVKELKPLAAEIISKMEKTDEKN